jgi:hypothetical protein
MDAELERLIPGDVRAEGSGKLAGRSYVADSRALAYAPES